MSDSSLQEGEQLFKKLDKTKKQDQDDQESYEEKQQAEIFGEKRGKKAKRDKKKKRKRHFEEDQQQDEEIRHDLKDLIEDMAQEDSNEQSQDNSSAQIMNEQGRQAYENLYKVKGKRATERFMDRIQGKQPQQVNKMYQHKAFKRRENQEMIPSELDYKMFIVNCKIGKQQELVLSILNKTAYYYSQYYQPGNEKYKMQIATALALKKKFPGKIFVEAESERVIRSSLDSFIEVNLRKIVQVDNELYSSLFTIKEDVGVQFNKDQYVRIRKGLYEGDLGKIYKIKKHGADVMIVPRINIQDILMKMREVQNKENDRDIVQQKKDDILKKYTNHRIYYPADMRPSKKLLPEDTFKDFSELPSNRRITITPHGLIIAAFRFDELVKLQGTLLPIELLPFSKNGNLAEQFFDIEEQKNFISTVYFERGDEAEVIAGQLTGCFGMVIEVKDNTVIIKCKNKEVKGKIIEEHNDHLAKRFKEAQRVRVIAGTDKGKSGLILKIDGIYADIWTDNENTIKINRNNLQLQVRDIKVQQNLLGLNKDELIKTTKGDIGIILSTNKENIKILDINNTIQLIGNLDFQTKIQTKSLFAKNKNGDVIKDHAVIRIKKGVHEGCRCEVKHVYRDFVFVFNAQFDKTTGMYVEKVDNCVLIAQSSAGLRRDINFRNNKIRNNRPGFGTEEPQDSDLKIGKSIIIGSGPLKGYRGVIKSVTKDRIEVRVAQKNITQWIQRDKIDQDEDQPGKTPKRGYSMTAMYAQSPTIV